MVDVINKLTDLTGVSKQSLKLMKIVIFRALGAQGGYLELARPCDCITLIEAGSNKLYESLWVCNLTSTCHEYGQQVKFRP